MKPAYLDVILTTAFYLLPLIFAFICLYYAFYFLRSARHLEDFPSSKIRSAAQGFVVLNGQAKSLLPEPILGMLTKKPCAWYYYRIEEITYTKTENEVHIQWSIIDKGVSQSPFILKDDSGECIIFPFNAEIIASNTIAWRGRTPNPPPPTSYSFWRQIFWENWGSYRYVEHRLELDAPIFARGNFATVSADNPLVSENDMLQAYCKANQLNSVNILSRENLEKNDNLMISTVPEKNMIRRLNIKSFLFFVAFVFFATLMVNNTYPIVKQILNAHWVRTR